MLIIHKFRALSSPLIKLRIYSHSGKGRGISVLPPFPGGPVTILPGNVRKFSSNWWPIIRYKQSPAWGKSRREG